VAGIDDERTVGAEDQHGVTADEGAGILRRDEGVDAVSEFDGYTW
jgi:hypothetical protein